MDEKRVYGIDLGTTYSCIAYVDEVSGKPVVLNNFEGDATTPSVVLFEDSDTRVVGKQAKNTAIMESDRVVELIKRQMGSPGWRWFFEGREYSPEEISSYILRKVVDDTALTVGARPTDVVITCPAYFGIPQREATATAGRIAGLNVLEVINEPTAAAISYGLQDERDQVVVVFDLGGGTFDVTMIEIKEGSVTVVATGGDHELGGRDWDKEVVQHLAREWTRETGSSDDPLDDSATRQELWHRAEEAKQALSARTDTKVAVNHGGRRVTVPLSRAQFDELTEPLLVRTVQYTRTLLDTARTLGYERFDQFLLVGGSTKMPQVAERLQKEFGLEPKVHDPDQAVAKGAAVYGQKLAIGQRIRIEIARVLNKAPEEVDVDEVAPEVKEEARQTVAVDLGMKLPAVKRLDEMVVTNVASHSFGIIAVDDSGPTRLDYVSNLVLAQDRLPAKMARTYFTLDPDQPDVELRIMENTERIERVEPDNAEKIGDATLRLTPNLPKHSPIEVTFELNQQGRLHITGQDLSAGGQTIEATIDTNRTLSEPELEEAMVRSRDVKVIG